VSVCATPHVMKVAKGGEDAWCVASVDGILQSGFATLDKEMSATAVGVADGVSTWSEMGVDPSIYPRDLMEQTVEYFATTDTLSSNDHVAYEAMHYGWSNADSEGASTAVVAALRVKQDDADGDAGSLMLDVAVLGDSAVMVVGGTSLRSDDGPASYFRTPAQLHGPNCPYQLHSLEVFADSDTPAMADLYELSVSRGDAVILASDGLFDNVFEHEIVDVLRSAYRQSDGTPATVARLAATALVEEAARRREDESASTPWSEARAEEIEENAADLPGWMSTIVKTTVTTRVGGGKMDDITAAVCIVE